MRFTVSGQTIIECYNLVILCDPIDELIAMVLEQEGLYKFGEISISDFATNVTHLNFDDRYSTQIRERSPHLARLVSDVAPDMEWQADDALQREFLQLVDDLLANN